MTISLLKDSPQVRAYVWGSFPACLPATTMPGPDIPLDKAYLSAIWLETLFYGMNFVLYGACLTMLTIRRRTPKVNKLLVAIATVMFAFSTAHVSLGFQRLIEGFIVLRDKPGGPGAFFSDVSIPANVVKVGIHTVNSIIGDSVVVWRCWLVWSRDWKMCVVPILLVIASAICGFAQTVYFARAKKLHSAFAHILQVWNGSLFSISLATNVTVSLLIALRVWYMFRDGGGSTSFRYWRVLVIIIESGMVYSVALVCEITLYFLKSNAFYIVYDPIAQLTAITPTLIIILAALQLTSNDVHSRLTRSRHGNIFKARAIDGSTPVPLDTIHFAANDAAPKSTGFSDSDMSSNPADFAFATSKPEGHISFA
ncbi:hypothetical protein PHLGIDRAFT_103546 [Phlebiopsis gigantea 11061_1 CR5-6]|uniref:Uncharacterized protein n=1 Tax=Phlebiopsis gigantea (strain 11061_1 CR5-6) TaxID=745531 RepID=A0A0C3SA62_PHLG1|nr:hypothetical protein PHLGIDRAFT_103546 [Phlebiopsis gigantea 11061_1 CR5-6]